MGQITVFERNFLGSKFFFPNSSPRTPLWVITRCPMSFGGGLELKNPKFERICEVGVDFAFQRADFDKIETLTLMQCIYLRDAMGLEYLPYRICPQCTRLCRQVEM